MYVIEHVGVDQSVCEIFHSTAHTRDRIPIFQAMVATVLLGRVGGGAAITCIQHVKHSQPQGNKWGPLSTRETCYPSSWYITYIVFGCEISPG